MPRLVTFAVFFGVALSIVAGIHWYIWVRLVRDTGLQPPWRQAATAAIVLLAASMPLAIVLGRALPPRAVTALAWPAYLWMGLMLILFLLFVAVDALRVLAWLLSRLADLPPPDPGRRALLARAVGGGVGGAALALATVATRTALGPLAVREVRVALPRLPREHDGTTIVQLTDLHLGPTLGRAFVEEVVRRTDELAPDIVAITGDLADESVERLRHAVAPLGRLCARYPVYFVTGNHEYFSGARAWVAELERIGIRVLRNERVAVERNGAVFDLVGVDDASAHRYPDEGHAADLAKALAGRDPARETVLLAHQPKAIHEASRLGVGLQLSGHTHGGQIWPFTYLVRLQQPFIAGLGRLGETQIYVSPGTGYWGPPMRLATRAEITRVVLTRAPAR